MTLPETRPGSVPRSERPPLDYRTDYQSFSRADRFVVPLLDSRMRELFGKYAVSTTGPRRALDVGCGGQPLRPMVEASGYSYASLDTRQNKQGTVDWIACIDEPLPVGLLSQGPFQFVLCTEVLEHVADWRPAFENLASLMSHGGHLLITCPFFYPLHEEPHDFWRPTHHAIRHFAGQSGLLVVECARAGSPWDVLGTLLGAARLRSNDSSLVARMTAKTAAVAQSILYRLLSSKVLHKHVNCDSPLYLSNVAILTKP